MTPLYDTEFTRAAGGLYLDGTWLLDGTKKIEWSRYVMADLEVEPGCVPVREIGI